MFGERNVARFALAPTGPAKDARCLMDPELPPNAVPAAPKLLQRCLLALKRLDWSTVGLILALKFLIFVFALQSVATLAPEAISWAEMWVQWDSRHYLFLAEKGYVSEGDDRVSLVFLPLYPWLTRGAAFFTGDYLLAAFVVSGFASIALGLLLQRLVQLDHSPRVARYAVWFLFIFPTSYFLHIAYTESLFLAFLFGCVLAARTNRWAWPACSAPPPVLPV